MRVLALATVPVVLFVLSLALLAGGGLGGVHGPFELRAVPAALATAGWLMLGAFSTVWLLGVRRAEDREEDALGSARADPEEERVESAERESVPASADEPGEEQVSEGTDEAGAPEPEETVPVGVGGDAPPEENEEDSYNVAATSESRSG